jgi:hypothetical protein
MEGRDGEQEGTFHCRLGRGESWRTIRTGGEESLGRRYRWTVPNGQRVSCPAERASIPSTGAANQQSPAAIASAYATTAVNPDTAEATAAAAAVAAVPVSTLLWVSTTAATVHKSLFSADTAQPHACPSAESSELVPPRPLFLDLDNAEPAHAARHATVWFSSRSIPILVIRAAHWIQSGYLIQHAITSSACIALDRKSALAAISTIACGLEQSFDVLVVSCRTNGGAGRC